MDLGRWIPLAAVTAVLVAVGLVVVEAMPYAGVARIPAQPPAPRATAAPSPSSQAYALAPAGPSRPCTAKLIDVDLSTQQLVATACGATYLATPITSGRRSLPTPTGTFSIYLKETDTYFYSPWPQGDPNYYPPMFVAYAMEFLDGGFFLHTDPDEPASAFGLGSQNGPYASHGCVHVPMTAMVSLFAWAGPGTAVDIHY